MSDVFPTAPSATVTRLERDAVPAEIVDQLRAGAIVAPADVGVIDLLGPGAGAITCFQGLLTSDIEKPGDGAFVYGALLTPKGMIVVDGWAARLGPRVRFTVPESALPAVLRSRREALRVLASPADDDSFALEGRLVFVDNAVDAATGTLLLKGEFANLDESLWPGEFVRVRLELARDPHAVVVPAAAVTAGPSGPFVYVLGADSTVSARPVEVARTAGSWVAVVGTRSSSRSARRPSCARAPLESTMRRPLLRSRRARPSRRDGSS